jgi:hypothetical protein
LINAIATHTEPSDFTSLIPFQAGTNIPNDLSLINDHNEHWLWQPSYTMVLEDYQVALRQVGLLFVKVS